jgi:hypothetical protein
VPIAFKNYKLPLAVVVTYTDWHEPPRIRHQVTNQLTRFYNVIYVVKQLENKKDSVEKISDRLIVYIPGINLFKFERFYQRLFANDPLTHYLVDYYFTKKILHFLNRYNSNKIILINFIYDFVEIMKLKLFDYKIYICFDEFPKMQRRSKKRNKILMWYQTRLFQFYEKVVSRKANKCLATHYPLRNKILNFNKETEFFPPGHEFKIISKNYKLISRKEKISVGYMGYINYRLKLEWISEILKNRDMVLNLIGPKERFDFNMFKSNKNINYISSLRGQSLLEKLKEMDVLIIPYDPELPEKLIQTAPNKLFQYIAAAKPIVISNLPHFMQFPHGVIYFANDEKEFVNKIREAYKEDNNNLIQLRLKIASENTWNIRGNRLFNIINSSLNSN